MKETPIIMSGNHSRLILDKLKTQTRRVMIPQPYERKEAPNCSEDWLWWPKGTDIPMVPRHEFRSWLTRCPYGRVGDRLWVRETWATSRRLDRFPPSYIGNAGTVALWYVENDNQIDNPSEVCGKWRPSIFMPRWASRIERVIKLLRPEQLRNISKKDAKAEGGYSIEEFIKTFLHLNHLPKDANPWNWVIGW